MSPTNPTNPTTPIRPVPMIVLNDSPAATPPASAPAQTPQVCPVQPQQSYFPPNAQPAAAQPAQTPAQPGTIAYFEQQMPDVVAAWDQMSLAIDMQARLSGPGWERAPVPQADVQSAIARFRALATSYQQFATLFGANAPINYEYASQRFTSEANRLEVMIRRGQQVPGGLLDIQQNGREVHIFGDVHGNERGLVAELNTADASGRTLLQRIQANEAVAIFLGDLAHPTPETGVPMDNMESSVRVEDRIRNQLKTMYPDNVFDLAGNHGKYFGAGEEAFFKAGMNQGTMYRDELIGQRRVGYARMVQEYADVSPLAIRIFNGTDLVATAAHSGVVKGGVSPQQVIRAALDHYVLDPMSKLHSDPLLRLNKNGIAFQMEWNRFVDDVGASDTRATRTGMGGNGRTVMCWGHEAGNHSVYQQVPGTVTLQFDDPSRPGHVVISRDGSSVTAVGDVDPAIAGMNLREQLPQMQAQASRPTVPPPAPAQAATAATAPAAPVQTPAEAFVDTGTFAVRMSAGDSMPLDVNGRYVTLRCGSSSFNVWTNTVEIIIEQTGTHQTWQLPWRGDRTNINGLFEITNSGGGKVQVKFAPRATPVANYSGVPFFDILSFAEPIDGPVNTGTFEEPFRPRTAQRAPSSTYITEIGREIASGIRGFFGGLFTMMGLQQAEHALGLDEVPGLRYVMEGANFYAGHVATMMAGSGMDIAAAATSRASLIAFYEGGGRFMAIMPVIARIMNALNLTPERMGALGYGATAIGSTMIADRALTAMGNVAIQITKNRLGEAAAARLGTALRFASRTVATLAWVDLAWTAGVDLWNAGENAIANAAFDSLELQQDAILAAAYCHNNETNQWCDTFDDYDESALDAHHLVRMAGDDGRMREVRANITAQVDMTRSNLISLIYNLLIDDINDSAQEGSYLMDDQFINSRLERLISEAYRSSSLPDGIAGNAGIDDDCDAGESACMDWGEVEEIDSYREFERMVEAGTYTAADIRRHFTPEEFELNSKRFLAAKLDEIANATGAFAIANDGSVDPFQAAIRRGSPSEIAALVRRDIMASWDLGQLTRMQELLSRAREVDGMLVIDEGSTPYDERIVSQMDISSGLVWDVTGDGHYVIQTGSPVYQQLEAMMVAQLAQMSDSQRQAVMTGVTAS